MKKQIICLSGWGQKSDSLNFIFDCEEFRDYEVRDLDYSEFSSIKEFFDYVSGLKLKPEILVGWSLGGQIALRLIAEGILSVKFLALLAPPFQMVKDARIQAGMAPATFEEFYHNFKKAPNQTLQQFAILMAMNDKNSKEIARDLNISEKNFANFVLWLEELKRFSFFDFDFSKTPRTLYFHGLGDMIVHASQADYFKARLPDIEVKMMKNCGHAPHLSDLQAVRSAVLEWLAWKKS